MNGQSLLTLLGTLGIPTLFAALFSYAGVRRQLKLSQPKNAAEAEVALAASRAKDIEAQGGIVARLSAENERLDRALISTSTRLDECKQRLDQLEEKFDTAEDNNRSLKRQNALLTESLERFSTWANLYYDAGHPSGMTPPPVITRFESD